jgi:fructosamine-3-kinase
MKYNILQNVDFFRAEAAGLAAIQGTGCIRTPMVLGYGADTSENVSFLLLEYIGGHGRAVAGSWECFGKELAAMHRAETVHYTGSGCYGFSEDNYIGISPQINSPCESWIEFFRSRRLEVQIRKAETFFDRMQLRKFQFLLEHLDDYLYEPDSPSLLHGDLWAGNVMAGDDGHLWMIDPAVYVGCREADLAMTELFGGYPEQFYRSYEEELPLVPGYRDRRDLYNLYHMLNHLNLFGGGYLSEVLWIVNRYVGKI